MQYTVEELIEVLKLAPQNAPVAIIQDEDYDRKKFMLSIYISNDGECVIQTWD